MRYVTLAVEGTTDEAVATRLCHHAGLEVFAAYPAGGKRTLDARLRGYNHAALFEPWFVLRDLNSDAECAPELLASLLPAPSPKMCFRLAVRTVESWLIADRVGLSRFLSVPVRAIPRDADGLPRPKRVLVDLARRSRRRSVIEAMVPVEGVSSEVGAGYTTQVVSFCQDYWDPARAAAQSDSLRRCIKALRAVR